MLIYVGTSGWAYSWNEGGSLDWYIENSGLNAVELNASFYRFPFKNQVIGWARRGKTLRWACKVHRLITHQHKLDTEALPVWEKFRELFQPLDPLIDFYLLQLPPSFKDLERAFSFVEQTGIGERLAIEFRNKEILKEEDLAKKFSGKAALVSLDSPDFQERIFPGPAIYLRMHGRTGWYSHKYSSIELTSISQKIKAVNPERVYIFFNNNHNMLGNARLMMEIMSNL